MIAVPQGGVPEAERHLILLLESTLQVSGKDLIVFYYSSNSWKIASYLLKLYF